MQRLKMNPYIDLNYIAAVSNSFSTCSKMFPHSTLSPEPCMVKGSQPYQTLYPKSRARPGLGISLAFLFFSTVFSDSGSRVWDSTPMRPRIAGFGL